MKRSLTERIEVDKMKLDGSFESLKRKKMILNPKQGWIEKTH